jgi:AbrB family looped-hinge helix DNA binding protein
MPSNIKEIKEMEGMSLVKITRNGQITLPASFRQALKVAEGDYLEAELVDGKFELRPVAVIDRAQADRRLEEILSRVKYIGSVPTPSEDELVAEVAEIIQQSRRENDRGGAR